MCQIFFWLTLSDLAVKSEGGKEIDYLLSHSIQGLWCFDLSLSTRKFSMDAHESGHIMVTMLNADICEQLESLYAQLKGEFEQLFALNHIGVLIHLADACQRLGIKQKSFIKVSFFILYLLSAVVS